MDWEVICHDRTHPLGQYKAGEATSETEAKKLASRLITRDSLETDGIPSKTYTVRLKQQNEVKV